MLSELGTLKPTCICVDGSENIYISDKEAHVIIKTNLLGQGQIISGQLNTSGNNLSEQVTSRDAFLNEPHGIDIDESGNIYLANTGLNQILRIGIDGTTVRIAGNEYGAVGNQDGNAHTSELHSPVDIAVEGRRIFFSDYENNSIKQITTGTHETITICGNGEPGEQNGKINQSTLNHPTGICLSPNGDLFIADSFNHKIKRLNKNKELLEFSGNGNFGTAIGNSQECEFQNIKFITSDCQGNIYAIDANDTNQNTRVIKLNDNGGSNYLLKHPLENTFFITDTYFTKSNHSYSIAYLFEP